MGVRHKAILVTTTCGVMFGMPTHAAAQDWLARYMRPADSADIPAGLDVDSAGHVYVVGQVGAVPGIFGGAVGGYYATVKYDPHGAILWERFYSGPEAGANVPSALELGPDGSIHVAGLSMGDDSTGVDIATLKYDSGGGLLWERRYDGVDHLTDVANAMDVDDHGNVCVVGSSRRHGTEHDYDYTTLKYGPHGNLLWAQDYSGPGRSSDVATAVQVDANGNVIVAGYSSRDDSGSDITILKYDPDGSLLWERRYVRPGAAFALAVDDTGNVYVAGEIYMATTRSDMTILKYDPEGDLLWDRHYAGPGRSSDHARAIQVDMAGNVYATGQSGRGETWDFVILKYDADGNLAWERRHHGPVPGKDIPVALSLGIDGSVFVAGTNGITDGDLWLDSYDYANYALVRYNTDGQFLGAIYYTGPAGNEDVAAGLAVDVLGNAYVTGRSMGIGSGLDIVTVKYSPCPTTFRGDMNCDGLVDLEDVVLLGNLIDGIVDLTGTCGECAADLDVDGDYDEDDYELLYDRVAGVGP